MEFLHPISDKSTYISFVNKVLELLYFIDNNNNLKTIYFKFVYLIISRLYNLTPLSHYIDYCLEKSMWPYYFHSFTILF